MRVSFGQSFKEKTGNEIIKIWKLRREEFVQGMDPCHIILDRRDCESLCEKLCIKYDKMGRCRVRLELEVHAEA